MNRHLTKVTLFLACLVALAQRGTDTTGSQTIQPGEPDTNRAGGTRGRTSRRTGNQSPFNLPPVGGIAPTVPTPATGPDDFCSAPGTLGRASGGKNQTANMGPPALSPPCLQSDGSLLFNECIRIVPDPQDPQFLTRAQQDLQKIASAPDPVGEVGSALISNLIGRLTALQRTIPIAEVRIRHGGVTVPTGRFQGFVSPFTRPSPTGTSTNDDLVSVTPLGSTVYDASGSPLLLAYITGTKGTGVGNGSTINYRPEDWPNLSICASGLISDVGLLHELLHASRFASATVEYQSFGWFTQDRDDFLTREEKWVVSKENRYRTLINDPNVKQRKTYKKDC